MADANMLRIERFDTTAVLTMNRAGALNALSLDLEAELVSAFSALGGAKEIRAIILTGAGRAFSAGVDLKELGDGAAALRTRKWHGEGSLADVMADCPKPIIAAVNGFAVTGGLELALQCDIIIAASTAKFADTHARVGITPSWGLSQILPRLVGVNRARQMSLTGEFIDAARAEAWGLINEVTAPDALMDRALSIAAEIAETDAVAADKIAALIESAGSTSPEEGLKRERAVFDVHIATVTPETIEMNRRRVQARGKRLAGGN